MLRVFIVRGCWMSLSKLQEIVKDREAGELQFMGSQRVRHDLATEQQQMLSNTFSIKVNIWFLSFFLFFSITAVKLEGRVFLPFVQPYLLLRKVQTLKVFWNSALYFIPTFSMLYFLSLPPDIASQLSILLTANPRKNSCN